MKKGILLFIAMAIFFFAPKAFAQETVWDMAQSAEYGKKVGGMLGRGLLNVATCFVDVVVHTVEGTQEGPPFVGTLTGLGSGIGCTALRVSSGALDIATFWVPGFNGIPVSRSYSNCLEMEEESNYAPSTPADMAMQNEPQTSMPPAQEEPQTVIPSRHHNPMDYVKK